MTDERGRRRSAEPLTERCEACGKMVPEGTLIARFVGKHAPLYAVVCEECDQLDHAALRYRWDHWQTVEAREGEPDIGGTADDGDAA